MLILVQVCFYGSCAHTKGQGIVMTSVADFMLNLPLVVSLHILREDSIWNDLIIIELSEL